MAEEARTPLTPRAKVLYGSLFLIGLIILGFVIESCDTEKVQICDTTSGKCALESTCRPLLYDLI